MSWDDWERSSLEARDDASLPAAMRATRRGWRVVMTRVAVFLAVAVIAGILVVAISLIRIGPVSERTPEVVAAPDVATSPRVATGGLSGGGAREADGADRAGGAYSGGSESDVARADSLPLSPVSRVDPDWAQRVASATGIPERALLAYASADLAIDEEQPSCGLGWNTIAAIGAIESGHGSHDGAVLSADGYPTPSILGPRLSGGQFAAVPDSDGGAWDGDARWDRAVGPMQFIPTTWAEWGADGNGDGAADPNQMDDAALAAARYLCAGGPLDTAATWRAAVFSYNNLVEYVDLVAATANEYAVATRSL